MQILDISQISDSIDALAAQASSEGFGSVSRLVVEYASGTNRFNREGECLLGAYDSGKIVGIGGVNVEPYEPESGAGRLRRFYVIKSFRRCGVGAALLRDLEMRSKPWFPVLQLFTPSADAGAFYEAMGFERCDRHKVSHAKRLAI